MIVRHFDTAGQIARQLVERHIQAPVNEPVLLNVNIPDLPLQRHYRPEVTRLGRRRKAEPVVRSVSPRKETVYWIGAAGAYRCRSGTDFHAVEQGRVSVTPLQVDLTHAGPLKRIRQWVQ